MRVCVCSLLLLRRISVTVSFNFSFNGVAFSLIVFLYVYKYRMVWVYVCVLVYICCTLWSILTFACLFSLKFSYCYLIKCCIPKHPSINIVGMYVNTRLVTSANCRFVILKLIYKYVWHLLI